MYLAIAHPTSGRAMFPSAQVTQPRPMTKARFDMEEISVLMLRGDWNRGSIAANDKICKTLQ